MHLENIGANPMIAISFDGLGTHNWMRNKKGCEELVNKNIKLCIEKGFSVNIAININKRTLPTLEKTIEYFINLGVKDFKLLRTSESYRWQQTEKECRECSRWKVCYGGICRMNVQMVSDIFGAKASPDKSYFVQRDMIYCSLMKENFIDKMTDILDDKQKS